MIAVYYYFLSHSVNRNLISRPDVYMVYKMRFNEASRDEINRVDETGTPKLFRARSEPNGSV